jgi:hypothetical protein
MYIQIKNTLKNKFNHIHKKTLKLLIIKIVNFIYNNSKIQVKSIISFSPLIFFFFFSCILYRQFILKNLISTSF